MYALLNGSCFFLLYLPFPFSLLPSCGVLWSANVGVVLFLPGNIENTEKLQYSGERLYKFTVTAYDCGKKRASDDAEVEIQVKPTCKPSWQGMKLFSETYTRPVYPLIPSTVI